LQQTKQSQFSLTKRSIGNLISVDFYFEIHTAYGACDTVTLNGDSTLNTDSTSGYTGHRLARGTTVAGQSILCSAERGPRPPPRDRPESTAATTPPVDALRPAAKSNSCVSGTAPPLPPPSAPLRSRRIVFPLHRPPPVQRNVAAGHNMSRLEVSSVVVLTAAD
jgi:hypothetical protein